VLATQLQVLQQRLLTQPLTATQWWQCVALALPVAIVAEVGKWIRRRRHGVARTVPVDEAVVPARARP
jgi:hypothetical protein